MSDSTGATNPTGGASGRRVPTQPALDRDLMSRVLDPANLRRAAKRVRRNGGAPGVDGMTVEELPSFVRSGGWSEIRKSLENSTYRPQPLRRKAIPKPNGGERLLGIPTVIDRLIQQAIAQVLVPIFDPEFSESSFGFRPGRSALGAVREVQRFIREGRRVAVDIDLEKFFDRVAHDVLMARVARRVGDQRLLQLIGRFLRAGVALDHELVPTTRGTPKGVPSRHCSPTSFSMTSTRSSRGADTDSPATPTTSSSSWAASAPVTV